MSGRGLRPQSLADAAWDYARRGWQVFPVQPGGKHPSRQVPHGLLEATRDPAQIRAWWAAEPRANVGVRTGAESGLVVLDIDGAQGVAALRDLVATHGRFTPPWVRTGSGGWHAYLAHPGVEVRNSAGKVGSGLDVRGDGGYAVAPPSRHASGARYRWVRPPSGALPPMPGWLLEATQPVARPPAPPLLLDRRRLPRYVTAAVEGEAKAVAGTPTGQRNHRLNAAAFRLGQLVGAGLIAEPTVSDALWAAAQAAGMASSREEERQALRTIRSGLEAGIRQPRAIEHVVQLGEARRGAPPPDLSRAHAAMEAER